MKTTGFLAPRRLFLKASAALAAPMTLLAGNTSAREAHDGSAALAARVTAFEDFEAIRELQRAYARHVSAHAATAAAQLFADPAKARLDAEIRGLAADPGAAENHIEIAADRRTARARMPCTVQLETPIVAPGWTLLDMARLQGEGVLRRTERRLLEQTFVRRNGVWKIEHAAYADTSGIT